MKVLVTGGCGVVGEGAIAALLQRGHEVRILSRFGDRGVRRWPRGVEARAGDIASAAEVNGSARGCDAIVHIAGIEEETLPDHTFDKVNVLGTRHVVAEAERAAVRRIVFVSALGAETGGSEYLKSKRRAEQVVRGCSRPWVILRPGAVYGPGDRNLSTILSMVRTLPAIPVIDSGAQRLQPLWYEDFGQAIARALDMPDVTGRAIEIAGPEQTSMNDLLDRIERLAGRRPRRVRVPAGVAEMGTQLASVLGFKLPITEAHLTMLKEDRVIAASGENALMTLLGVDPTPLEKGLRQLAGVLPEQLPEEGVGSLVHKRYWADIDGSYHRAGALRDVFRRNLAQAMPFEVRPERGPLTNVKKGMTISVTLPLRGIVSLRIEEVTPQRIVAATVEGHPLAGLVTFNFLERGAQVRFEVEVFARGADVVDAVLLAAMADFLQDVNWQSVVERVVQLSGGRAPAGVQTLVTAVDDEAEVRKIEEWAAALVVRRMRGRVPPGPPIDGRRRARREPVVAPPARKKPAARKPNSRTAAAAKAKKTTRPEGPRRVAGTGNARRTRAGSGSARTTGRSARPALARKATRKSR
jgi:nucleoside-diphosphate-sugar epimerase